MRKSKRNIPVFLCVMLCFFSTGFKTATAQNRNWPSDLNKYEIAIDLQKFFSDGYPDKVLFKINNLKENKIKGAYRFGIDASFFLEMESLISIP